MIVMDGIDSKDSCVRYGVIVTIDHGACDGWNYYNKPDIRVISQCIF